MKVSRQQAAENRERIVEAASRLFREKGYDGVGVADLMRSVGLTHGGFYGHFESKEELMEEASLHALNGLAQDWSRLAGSSGDPVRAIAAHYLCLNHRDDIGKGCLFAALGPELTRHGASLRRSATAGLMPFLDLLAGIVPGKSKASKRKAAIAVYASLIGGMVLARVVDDPKFSESILQAVAGSLPDGEKRTAKAR